MMFDDVQVQSFVVRSNMHDLFTELIKYNCYMTNIISSKQENILRQQIIFTRCDCEICTMFMKKEKIIYSILSLKNRPLCNLYGATE